MRTAVAIGYDHHTRSFARLVNDHLTGWRIKGFASTRAGTAQALAALPTADALVVFGGPAPHAALAALAHWRMIPVVIIWAGSDVIELCKEPQFAATLRLRQFHHVAVAPWLIDELRAVGIDAKYLRVAPVPARTDIPRFPKTFTVLAYLPERATDFYGRPTLFEVAERMQDTKFVVVGKAQHDERAPKNVAFAGWTTDIWSLIEESTALVRATAHDGMSNMVLESLSRARHVAWTYEIPGVQRIKSVDDVTAFLCALKGLHDAGKLELNVIGQRYVREQFDPADVAMEIGHFLDGLHRHQTTRAQPPHTVAISGLDLFTAQLVEINMSAETTWETRLLRFNSRFDILMSLVTLARSDVWYSLGTAINSRWLTFVAWLFRKPRVMHWVGTDIDVAYANPGVVAEYRRANVHHLAEVQWTAQELARLGINATIAPLPPMGWQPSVASLPDTFTVLCYVPLTRSAFYGSDVYRRLIAEFRDCGVRFLIVGGGTLGVEDQERVENLGWQRSLDEAYRRSTVYLRFPQHDGLSIMVLEALAHARYVLWNHEFPYVDTVMTYEHIAEQLRRLSGLHAAGMLAPQYEAAAFVRRCYEPVKCLKDIATAWLEAKTGDRAALLVTDSLQEVKS